MIAGFGQGSAMTKSVKNNKEQLRTRKFLNTDSKDLKLSENELKFNKFNEEEHRKFKEKLTIDKKRDKRNQLIIYGLFLLAFITVIYFFNFF